jgi:hypothetical protein
MKATAPKIVNSVAGRRVFTIQTGSQCNACFCPNRFAVAQRGLRILFGGLVAGMGLSEVSIARITAAA